LTAATDFFSLGCILYEVLTGKRAFQRESVADTLSAILNDEVDFGDIHRPLPDDLIRITRRCLAKCVAAHLRPTRPAPECPTWRSVW